MAASSKSPEKMAGAIKADEKQEKQPGLEGDMQAKPLFIRDTYKGSGKLQDKVAIITGGDSGIGRAVAVHFAREGADVAIVYLDEHKDAEETAALVEKEGRKCLKFAGDVGNPGTARDVVAKVVEAFNGRLDILVNNASEQHVQESLTDITPEQLQKTFATNLFGYFYFAQAALPHLKEGSSLINTSSVTAYAGKAQLVDYSASKGAQDSIDSFKTGATMPRNGQPAEVAPCYVFLASEDSSYISGQTLHPNGGSVING